MCQHETYYSAKYHIFGFEMIKKAPKTVVTGEVTELTQDQTKIKLLCESKTQMLEQNPNKLLSQAQSRVLGNPACMIFSLIGVMLYSLRLRFT